MKNCMKEVMAENVLQGKAMGFSRLTAMDAIVPLQGLRAVQTNLVHGNYRLVMPMGLNILYFNFIQITTPGINSIGITIMGGAIGQSFLRSVQC